MQKDTRPGALRWNKHGRQFCVGMLALFFLMPVALPQTAAGATRDSVASVLLGKHTSLAGKLLSNAYGRQLFLESSESSSMVSGNAYAVLDSPFNAVNDVLKNPSRWCEIMILHINTKYCQVRPDANPTQLQVNIGKKTEQELADSFALEFVFRVASSTAEYLEVQLNADKGPMGTNNYRIELQATPLPGGKTFMLLRYAYGYGLAGRLAMQGYLATAGSGKVGFTQVEKGGKRVYVGGMRGTVERNTMRYYLAIEAYLSAMNSPASNQFEARLQHWFKATEQFPDQLREMDLGSYVSMKKNEYRRQQKAVRG